MALVWKEPSKDHRLFAAEINGMLEPAELRAAFVDVWRFFLSTVIPLNRREEWNYLRFEFWLDSGRCELFVAHSDRAERIDRGSCRLVSHELAGIWNRCATDYSHSDDEFIRALVEEEKKIMGLAVEAADIVAQKQVEFRGLEVEFWNADSEHLESFIVG